MKIASFGSAQAYSYAALGLVAIGVLYFVNKYVRAGIKDTVDAVGTGAANVAEGVGGVISGHNVITESARTTAYEGMGVLGTLGAGFDIASGGLFSTFGEWLSGKEANVGNYFDSDPNPSAAIQSSNNNPYGPGTARSYFRAADESPTQASVVASPWAIEPIY